MLRCRRGPLVDIGSGDGRIVIAAAKEGFTAVGYELNPWLVWYSRYCARREGVQASAKFYISDLWKVTFSQYSNVVIFGVPQMQEDPVGSGPWSPAKFTARLVGRCQGRTRQVIMSACQRDAR
ncbi:hypothetical protein ESR_17993, partial [Eschrichtius robustus]|nr:hypothetical protein [Eschrichtius robustus]